ncbi:MAG: hypothetical protein ACPGXY_02020 [Alphaproteobacteria bacterium]
MIRKTVVKIALVCSVVAAGNVFASHDGYVDSAFKMCMLRMASDAADTTGNNSNAKIAKPEKQALPLEETLASIGSIKSMTFSPFDGLNVRHISAESIKKLSEIKALSEVRGLCCRPKELKLLRSLSNLRHLQFYVDPDMDRSLYVDTNSNRFLIDLSELFTQDNLPKLVSLQINFLPIQVMSMMGAAGLDPMPPLGLVTCGHMPVKNFESLLNLKSLKSLKLDGCKIHDAEEYVEFLKKVPLGLKISLSVGK